MFYHGNMNDEEAYNAYLLECEYYEEQKRQEFEEGVYHMTCALVEELGADVEMAEYALAHCYYDFHAAKKFIEDNFLSYESFQEHVYKEFKSLKSSHYKDDFEIFLATDYQNSDFMAAFLSENDVNIYFSDPIVKDKERLSVLEEVLENDNIDEYEFI